MNKIEKFSKKYKTELTDKEKNYICKFDYRCSQFYGLPKIHKSNIIKEAIDLSDGSELIHTLEPPDLKLRPIVAGPCCPTNRLSELLDKILQPYQNYVKSYSYQKQYPFS